MEFRADKSVEGYYGSSYCPFLEDIQWKNAQYHISSHHLQDFFPSEFRHNIDPRGSTIHRTQKILIINQRLRRAS